MFKEIVHAALITCVGRPLGAIRPRKAGLLPPVWRKEFVASVPEGRRLELGPFYCPQLSDCEYFDILTQEELRGRAVHHGKNPDGCPVIQHVSPIGDLSTVPGTFAAVFSSHVIEHQPDLIGHLNHVADLLEPSGAYYVIVPDKRYCFDYFNRETTLADVDAQEGQLFSSARQVASHYHNATHNNPVLHWIGFHGKRGNDTAGAEHSIAQLNAGEYVDTHNWQFTPASFLQIVQTLYETGRIRLRPAVHDTGVPELEFMAVLSS